jgi:hypothetical protein
MKRRHIRYAQAGIRSCLWRPVKVERHASLCCPELPAKWLFSAKLFK